MTTLQYKNLLSIGMLSQDGRINDKGYHGTDYPNWNLKETNQFLLEELNKDIDLNNVIIVFPQHLAWCKPMLLRKPNMESCSVSHISNIVDIGILLNSKGIKYHTGEVLRSTKYAQAWIPMLIIQAGVAYRVNGTANPFNVRGNHTFSLSIDLPDDVQITLADKQIFFDGVIKEKFRNEIRDISKKEKENRTYEGLAKYSSELKNNMISIL